VWCVGSNRQRRVDDWRGLSHGPCGSAVRLVLHQQETLSVWRGQYAVGKQYVGSVNRSKDSKVILGIFFPWIMQVR
jgi:hypothetical protein